MTEQTNIHISTYASGLDELRDKWRWLLGVGIVWVVLGTFALIMPLAAGLAVELVLGAVLTLGGISQCIHGFSHRAWHGSGSQILGGLLATVAGLLLLFFPMSGVMTLTLLLSMFFIFSGAIRLFLSTRLKGLSGSGLMMTSSILGIVIGILILVGWPTSSMWAIGVLAGIELIFSGFALASFSLALRKD